MNTSAIGDWDRRILARIAGSVILTSRILLLWATLRVMLLFFGNAQGIDKTDHLLERMTTHTD
jgi:hypothetical protein